MASVSGSLAKSRHPGPRDVPACSAWAEGTGVGLPLAPAGYSGRRDRELVAVREWPASSIRGNREFDHPRAPNPEV